MRTITQIAAVFWAGIAVVGFLSTLLLMKVFPMPQPYDPPYRPSAVERR